jgi:hypothetical protein
MDTTRIIIPRPSYGVTSLKDALAFNWRGWHISRKLDGCWQQRNFHGSILVGEIMQDKTFYAFDLPIAFGEDVRRRPWTERRAALLDLAQSFTPDMAIAPEGHGAEFIEAVIAAGGEGCVAKPLGGRFGENWFKIKRSETHDCTVTEKHPSKLSIHISENGIDRGWCAVLGGDSFGGYVMDKIRVGDMVEIECYGVTAKDKFREPRFVRPRADKTPEEILLKKSISFTIGL